MTLVDDVIICCCDAPSASQREWADYLAGHELLFRMQTVDRTWDTSFFPMDAESDFQRAVAGSSPSGAAPKVFPDYRQFCCHGGPWRANVYWFSRREPSVALGIGAVGYGTPVSPALLREARDGFTARATELVEQVRSAMGSAFDAERRQVQTPYLPSGTPLPLYSCLGTAAGPFTRPAGVYRIQMTMDVQSPDDFANPTTVSLGIAVNGVVVETATATRAAYEDSGHTVLKPAGPERYGDIAHLESDKAIALAGTGEITIVNTNTLRQMANGVVRIFPA